MLAPSVGTIERLRQRVSQVDLRPGGGNEINDGLWLLLVSLARPWRAGGRPKTLGYVSALDSVAGLFTTTPPILASAFVQTAGWMAMLNEKVVPTPTSLMAVSCPPIACTRRREITSPMPMPAMAPRS